MTPVECPNAPRLHPKAEDDTRRAGHYFRCIDGVWLCRYCETQAARVAS